MQPLLETIVASLDSIAGLERIWKKGVVHRGGSHYRLRGTFGPASIGEDECLVLGKLIAQFEPANCFVIGNGFGLSSVWIAKLMEASGGRSVVTLDNKSEGDGERCFEVARELSVRLDCRILRNCYGISPRDIRVNAEGNVYDLIFIDGDHSHPQVVHDFRGVQSLLSARGILCWHDYWLAGVAESVDEARRSGFHCLKVNTSCEVVFGTRDRKVFGELEALFENTKAPTRRNHPLARLRLTHSYLTASFRKYLL